MSQDNNGNGGNGEPDPEQVVEDVRDHLPTRFIVALEDEYTLTLQYDLGNDRKISVLSANAHRSNLDTRLYSIAKTMAVDLAEHSLQVLDYLGVRPS